MCYTAVPEGDIYEKTVDLCEDIEFDVENSTEPFPPASGEHARAVEIPYDDWSVTLRFNLDPNREEKEPVLTVGGFTGHIYPPNRHDAQKYQQRMDVVFELVCRLSITLDADYLALADTEGRANEVVPTGRPIGEVLDTVPRMGVFSASVIEGLGGLDAMYTDPWYTATLESGQTLVIESADPWSAGDWVPPTDAPYIADAQLRTDDGPSSAAGVSDPFAALDAGEFGAEVGVHVDDIAEEFVNEDLELVRVYVDEDRNLRRVDTDTFVRNVVDDADSDIEMMKGMLGDVPPDANQADQLASALFHEAIPPSFVRLDSPDDENVVTRVMDLDVEMNKYDLLLSLGAAASGDGFTNDDLETMEQALDNLADLEDVDGVERLIEERLL